MNKNIFFILPFLTPAASLASVHPVCPRLEGTYRCPANSKQGELQFTLTRLEELKGVHRYTFRYSGYPDSIALASEFGTLNDIDGKQYWVYCAENSLFYIQNGNQNGYFQQSFLSKQKEYVVKVRGKEVARCPRVR